MPTATPTATTKSKPVEQFRIDFLAAANSVPAVTAADFSEMLLNLQLKTNFEIILLYIKIKIL